MPDALALSAACFLIAGSMRLPLIWMDPDDYGRFNNDVMFLVPSIFPTLVTFSAASARKNAAGSREQGGNAY